VRRHPQLCGNELRGDKDRSGRVPTPSEMVRRLVARAIERLDKAAAKGK
jgi:hypothetical protein